MALLPDIGRLLLDGYGEEPEPNVDRTTMENGFVKQASVGSGGMVLIPVRYACPPAGYAAWWIFWRDQIQRGAGWFQWLDPRTGEMRDVRVVGGEWRSKAYSSADGAELSWEVEMTLEYWD